jgi:hypothetical protein
MSRRKERQDPVLKQARLVGVPQIQRRPGTFAIVDIANRTEADQRHMVRSGEKRTVRRMTHLEKLYARKVLTLRQLRICEWYADQHERGFATTCHISNYGSAGGSAPGSMDLLSKTRDQFIAREQYRQAKASIRPCLVGLFESVVLMRGELGDGETWRRKNVTKNRFRLAVDQLDRACGHLAGGE